VGYAALLYFIAITSLARKNPYGIELFVKVVSVSLVSSVMEDAGIDVIALPDVNDAAFVNKEIHAADDRLRIEIKVKRLIKVFHNYLPLIFISRIRRGPSSTFGGSSCAMLAATTRMPFMAAATSQ
jgi:hypothetical protein